MVFSDAAFQSEKLPEKLTNLSGKATLRPDQILWDGVKVRYQNTDYVTSGRLSELPQPLVQAQVSSKDLSFETTLKWLQGSLRVDNLHGKYLQSIFTANGFVDLPVDGQPRLNIKGRGNLDLKDLFVLIPRSKEDAKGIVPEGQFAFELALRGTPGDWRNWNTRLSARSPSLTLKPYKMTDLNFSLTQSGGYLEDASMKAQSYGGTVALQGSADLHPKDMPFTAKIEIQDIDLAKLKEDNAWKGKNVSGSLAMAFAGGGNLNDIKTLEGDGSVRIDNGRIWELNLFEGLGKYLFIPEYSNITFHEATGDFSVSKEKVRTDNLTLKSEPVDLLCRGWVNFKGNISFGVFSKFSQETISQSGSLKKTITSFLTRTDEYLTIRLTGSLNKPSYMVLPSSVDLFKRTADYFLEGLQDILP